MRLTHRQAWSLGRFDNAKRWYPDKKIAEYFETYRSPSNAWPYSYLHAATTKKFYKWMQENHPTLLNSIK
jgi:hypothetical protein